MAIQTTTNKLNNTIYSDIGLLVLRFIAAGMLIFWHGSVKIIHIIHGNFAFGDPIGIGVTASLILAGFAEGICAFFVAIGLYTRIAAFILVLNFIVAYFSGFDEKALLYLGIYVALMLIGAGKYSVDELRK